MPFNTQKAPYSKGVVTNKIICIYWYWNECKKCLPVEFVKVCVEEHIAPKKKKTLESIPNVKRCRIVDTV